VGGDDLFGRSADLQDGDPVDVGMQTDPLVGPVPLRTGMRGVSIQSDHVMAGQPGRPARREPGQRVGDLGVQHDPVVPVQGIGLPHHGPAGRLADLTGLQRVGGLGNLGQPERGGELGSRRPR